MFWSFFNERTVADVERDVRISILQSEVLALRQHVNALDNRIRSMRDEATIHRLKEKQERAIADERSMAVQSLIDLRKTIFSPPYWAVPESPPEPEPDPIPWSGNTIHPPPPVRRPWGAGLKR